MNNDSQSWPSKVSLTNNFIFSSFLGQTREKTVWKIKMDSPLFQNTQKHICYLCWSEVLQRRNSIAPQLEFEGGMRGWLLWVSATSFLSWAINQQHHCQKHDTELGNQQHHCQKHDTLSFFREKFGLGSEIVCCRGVSHDESEPALTSAPVGHSVHRMGSCVFSSGVWPCFNQHCSTINPFLAIDLWLYFDHFFFNPWPSYYVPT